MPQNRETRRLTQNKQNSIEIKKHTPSNSEGNNGDITIRQLPDGVFLFFKALGKWYKTLNTSSEMSSDPHSPRSFRLGNIDKPIESMFVRSQSIHIGDTKANNLKLGTTGSGEEVKLQTLTPSGDLVADESNIIQTVDGDMNLHDADAPYRAVETSVINTNSTLTISDGVDFSIVALDPSKDEEERINKRRLFDVTLRRQINGLWMHFGWLKAELSAFNIKKSNALAEHLSTQLIPSAQNINGKISEIQLAYNSKLEEINNKFDNLASSVNGIINILEPEVESLGISTLAGNSITHGDDTEGFEHINEMQISDLQLNSIENGILNILDKDDFKAETASTIGSYWTFTASTDIWRCYDNRGDAQAHGLSVGEYIKFQSMEIYPKEYEIGIKYYIKVVESVTEVKLHNFPTGTSYIDGTNNSTGTGWVMADIRQLSNGTDKGYLNIMGQGYYPQDAFRISGSLYGGADMNNLVENETYTKGGVCSILQHATEESCLKAGGTWYP